MKKAVIVMLLLFAAGVAQAQTVPGSNVPIASTDTAKQSQPYSVTVTHDGINTDFYVLYEQAPGSLFFQLVEQKPVNYLVNGTITFTQFANGRPKGIWYYYVMAANNDGGTANSDALQVTVTTGNPNKPGPPKIIKSPAPAPIP